jgi:hypothetical protein
VSAPLRHSLSLQRTALLSKLNRKPEAAAELRRVLETYEGGAFCPQKSVYRRMLGLPFTEESTRAAELVQKLVSVALDGNWSPKHLPSGGRAKNLCCQTCHRESAVCGPQQDFEQKAAVLGLHQHCFCKLQPHLRFNSLSQRSEFENPSERRKGDDALSEERPSGGAAGTERLRFE